MAPCLLRGILLLKPRSSAVVVDTTLIDFGPVARHHRTMPRTNPLSSTTVRHPDQQGQIFDFRETQRRAGGGFFYP